MKQRTDGGGQGDIAGMLTGPAGPPECVACVAGREGAVGVGVALAWMVLVELEALRST